jgi:hypothetical protein
VLTVASLPCSVRLEPRVTCEGVFGMSLLAVINGADAFHNVI